RGCRSVPARGYGGGGRGHRGARGGKRRRRERGGIRPWGGRAGECDEPVRQRQRVRCRGSPSFPCSVRAFRRYPGAQLLRERANLLGGLREFRAETSGLPDLKLVAEAGEGHLVLDPAVILDPFLA